MFYRFHVLAPWISHANWEVQLLSASLCSSDECLPLFRPDWIFGCIWYQNLCTSLVRTTVTKVLAIIIIYSSHSKLVRLQGTIHRVALGTIASCFRCTFETKVSQIPWVPAWGHTFWALSNHQAGELGKCFQNSQKGIQYVLYLDNVITTISHIQLKNDSVTLYGQ